MSATPAEFDDIRPYDDSQINAAMRRIAGDARFSAVISHLFPGQDPAGFCDALRGIDSVDEFQTKVMDRAVWAIVRNSTTGLTWGGLERLDPSKSYVFISNHRDILLDSALLQVVLKKHGRPTTEITFGSNLMQGQLVIDIGCSNKMFKVVRGGSPREFHRNSLHLSRYIRHVITEKHESVWIAQRNGRTKNGIDATDQGLIKMLLMSRRSDPAASLAELNIVPVAISYQWEPCDGLKARETVLARRGPYAKAPGEDLNSILQGIVQPKGNVHLQVCEPVSPQDILSMGDPAAGNLAAAAARLLDERIKEGYRLWDTNYAAADLLGGDSRYSGHYDRELMAAFTARMHSALSGLDIPMEELRGQYLEIYANPVIR